MRYLAVIGDIKNSRGFSERGEIQRKLNEVLSLLSIKYADEIVSDFTITLGDEFQGLFLYGTDVIQIITEIEQQMYPVKIRFGIGIGDITTKINPHMAIGADGPGYYKARAAIDYLKVGEKKNGIASSDIRIEAENENKEFIALLNTIFVLLSAIKNDWTDRQREIIGDMLTYQDGQTNVANRLRITQSTVQRALVAGKYYAYKDALETVNAILKGMGKNNV